MIDAQFVTSTFSSLRKQNVAPKGPVRRVQKTVEVRAPADVAACNVVAGAVGVARVVDSDAFVYV